MGQAKDSGDQPHDPVGSLGEEAAKLLGALSSWAVTHGADLGRGAEDFADQVREGVRHAARESEEHFATGAAECTYCPVCRTVHAVREVSPEVKEHLRSAGISLLHAASGLIAALTPEPAPSADRAERARPTDGVEHIDLDPDGEDQ